MVKQTIALTFTLLTWTALVGVRADGDDAPPNIDDIAAPTSEPAKAAPINELSLKQSRVADRYARLEELLRKLSEFEQAENPNRAKLLEQAFEQSKNKLTKKELDAVVDRLRTNRLKLALDGQQRAKTDLLELFELLKSEDRGQRIKDEQQRIKEYIKEVERLIRIEQSLRGQNEGGVDADKLAQAQGKAADRAGNLAKEIQQNEAGGKSPAGSKPGESSGDNKGQSEGDQKGDSEGKSKGDSEGKSKGDSEGKSKGDSEGNSKGDSEGKSKGDSEGKSKGDSEGNSKGDSEGNKKGDSEGNSKGNSEGDSKGDSEGDSKGDSQGDSKGDSSGGGKSGDSKSQPSENKAEENPVRKRIQAAEEKMRDAQRKLEEAKRKESIEDQRKAEEELKLAKKELEEILKQLREEEVDRMLAMLEGRFRKMLERELRVYESTKRIDRIPAAQRSNEINIETGQLSDEQHKIAIEASRALVMLREEGSSVAFPETVEQMYDDMEQVSRWLAEVRVGRLTQELEEEIIDSLDYLIEALVKAQQDPSDQKPPPPGQQPPGPPPEQPLVDQLAEMKMIRGLQERVNKRHTRYAQLLDDPDDPLGVTDDPEMRSALERLAERQATVHRITRDIVLGKNE